MEQSATVAGRKIMYESALPKVLLTVLLLVGLVPAASLQAAEKAFADTGTVTTVSWDDSITEYGWTQNTKYMELNGQFAMCCQHFAPTPSQGATATSLGTVTNDLMRKVAWYGWGGPGTINALSLVQTACAMSNANNTDITLTGRDALAAVSGLASPPSSFVLTKWSTGGTTQDLITWTYNPTGAIALDKDSSNTAITDGNGCYSLAGAVYGVYRNAACTDLWFSQTTDANGVWTTASDIPVGTYWVKEITAPSGYALDTQAYQVDVSAGATAAVNNGKVYDVPQNDPAVMWVGKIDLDTTLNMPQGSASLEDAEFTVRYFDGQYATAANAEASGAATRTWVVKTNEQGVAAVDSRYIVPGSDPLYSDSDGNVTIPLGTLLIQETKAPVGYVLDDSTVYVRNVTTAGSVEEVDTYNAPTQPEQVIRGGVSIDKRDIESLLATPLGAASLDGATLAIKTQSDNAVVVNGKSYTKGQTVASLTVKDGKATTAANLLPFGSYTVEEVTSGVGYLVSIAVLNFDVRENNKIVELTGANGMLNQVKRGDLEFVKASEADMSRLAGVPFKITSKTTGESHVIVTDANGYASTSASYNKHTANTNANDKVGKGTYNSEAGIWFGLTTENTTVAANDKLGALPYDTYDIEELACAANDGLQLVKVQGVVITRDNYVVTLGTIDDPQASLGTTATDALDGDKIVFCDEAVTINDCVAYYNVIPGRTYTVSGTLMDKSTNKELLVGGKNVTATATFTPTQSYGTIDVPFTFNALGLGNIDVVAFESLACEGRIVAEHKDITDEGQTVKIVQPEIGTTATDGIDGDKNIVTDPEAVIVDTVGYKNLIVGKEYTATGTLMDKATNEALLVNGAPVTSQATFIPEASEGTVDVTFKFASSLLADKELVAFEEVSKDGITIAVHTDINDEGQTVVVTPPEIGTAAVDGFDSDKIVVADKHASIVDTIAYKNLAVGKEYIVSGTLMDKSTGEALVVNGKPVVAEATFIPEQATGTVDVTFEFDGLDLESSTLVAFESLTRLGVEVAVHADINDEGQTVKIVPSEIGTSASDKTDGDKNLIAGADAVIVDKVNYTNLIPGKEYVMKGKLMDKFTGKALLVNDKEITSELRFTPNTASGVVELEFVLDSSALAGKSVVVFEDLYKDDVLVATHSDINDESQTVQVVAAPAGSTYDKTGVNAAGIVGGVALLGLASAGAVVYGLRQRKLAATAFAEGEETTDSNED